jgi:DNA-binding IclR family transcriptional regulator
MRLTNIVALCEQSSHNVNVIQAVDRALRLLDLVVEAPDAQTGAELATAAGINRSTAWRLLATLEAHHIVERDPDTNRYGIGLGAMRLAALTPGGAIARRARPLLERLALDAGEAATLTIGGASSLVVIDQVDAPQVVNVRWTGRAIPVESSSVGKLVLASWTDAEIVAYLGDRLTDGLRADVAAARATGIGTTFSEYEQGLNGISAAARDRDGHPVAYLSVTGPDYRLSASRTAEITPLLLGAARELEQALGLTS